MVISVTLTGLREKDKASKNVSFYCLIFLIKLSNLNGCDINTSMLQAQGIPAFFIFVLFCLLAYLVS